MNRAGPSEPASDESLMARYASGDAEAFDALFARYEARAYAYFRRRTGSREQAQDLYQELFLRIHRARDVYEPARPFAPWFFAIARRLWLDEQGRAHRSREIPLGDREPAGESSDAATQAAGREVLAQVLGSLSSEERVVLLAAKLEGRPYGEIAVALGKSADAVKKLASRTLQRLRASAQGESAPARAAAG